jgi:hypothetical protein
MARKIVPQEHPPAAHLGARYLARLRSAAKFLRMQEQKCGGFPEIERFHVWPSFVPGEESFGFRAEPVAARAE